MKRRMRRGNRKGMKKVLDGGQKRGCGRSLIEEMEGDCAEEVRPKGYTLRFIRMEVGKG